MKLHRHFNLILRGNEEGPYTEVEIRARLTELHGEHWHWGLGGEQPDGSYVAVDSDSYRVLAEAVPVAG